MPPRPHWYYHMRPDYYPFYYNPWYYRPGWLPVYDAIIYPWWIVGGVRTGTCVYVYNTNTYIPSDSYYLEPTAGTGQAQLPPPDPVDNSAPNITKEQIQDAWKKIQAADTTFAEGKYEDAMKQYQAVADAIPQMPDPWVRMTIAALAEDDFEWAVQASLHGMTLATGWPCSPFSLDYMYQQNREKKADDLKMLNAVVGANAQNSDIMFLAGMIYYFDGQKDEATRHLNLAKQMEPDLNDFVEPMIKNLDEAKAKQPAAN